MESRKSEVTNNRVRYESSSIFRVRLFNNNRQIDEQGVFHFGDAQEERFDIFRVYPKPVI